jgi:hypothetical protein
MLYEWRTYEAMPGKLPVLHTHLEVAAGLFKKHNLGVKGIVPHPLPAINASTSRPLFPAQLKRMALIAEPLGFHVFHLASRCATYLAHCLVHQLHTNTRSIPPGSHHSC